MILHSLLLFCLLSNLRAEHRVLGVGSYIWDYIQPVDDDFLDALYLSKRDELELDWHSFCEILSLARFQPAPSFLTGGSVANTIKGLSALGASCGLTGNAGLDQSGDQLLKALQKCGIETYATRSPTPTAHVICLVTSDGERSFCSFVQSCRETVEADLLPQYFENRDLVHIEGYLIPNQCVIERAAQLAKNSGATVTFDIGNSQLGERYRERLWAFLSEYVDILFVDIDEAYALTHLPPAEACKFLSNFCKIAVVKVEAEGCYVSSGDQHLHQAAIPTTVVDSTGAGDLFASGFIYGYLEGSSLEQCALFGNLMGSAAIERYGGEIPKYRLNEIVQAMH